MPAFEYQALNSTGQRVKGSLSAETARQARQQLRDQGLHPLALEQIAERQRRFGALTLPTRGIPAGELALITRQLATLVRAGLPLEEALGTVARQAERSRLRTLLAAVRARVTEGHSLSQGLADFPGAFPDIYRTTIAAGEQTGHLDLVLERLADYTEARQRMLQKVQLALIYPALLTLMAILVTLALLTYVVPEVVQVFTNIDQELPGLTRALIATSDALRSQGPWLSLVLVIGGGIFAVLLRRPGPRMRWHRVLLRLPLAGRLIRGMNTARFARTLSILSSSGVAVLEALRISAQVIGNLPMRAAVNEATDRVREGSEIGVALERSGQFPPMTLHLIRSGEASGQLDAMLERAAINQEEELQARLAMLMGLLEPLLILVMGGIVLVIVLAILLPIFELNQLVQ